MDEEYGIQTEKERENTIYLNVINMNIYWNNI